MGFGVVHCCYYDKIYLQVIDMGEFRLQRAIGTDIQYMSSVLFDYDQIMIQIIHTLYISISFVVSLSMNPIACNRRRQPKKSV